MENHVKQGRSILYWLLPAFFLFYSSASISVTNQFAWPNITVSPGCNPNYSIGYPDGALPYSCRTLGDAMRLCQRIADSYVRYFYPSYYLNIPLVIYTNSTGYPSGLFYQYATSGFGFFASCQAYNNSFPSKHLLFYGSRRIDNKTCGGWSHECIHIYADSFSRVLTSYYFGDGMFACISNCKSDLSSKKTAIQQEGASLFSGLTNSPAALPCYSYLCLTGMESQLQPISNAFLLIGSLGAGFIVFRKKPKKGRDRHV